MFFPFSIKTSKSSGSFNNINDPYAKLCIPDIAKNSNVKVFNLMPRTNETRTQNGMKRVNVNADQMQVFIIINNAGMVINASVNAKNCSIKVYVIKDLFGIQVIVSVNVINHVILVSIQTMETVSARKNQLINQLKDVLKMLKK